MIRSESLEAVGVEAPEGQPMIHRRHTRQRMPRPTEGKAERKEAKSLGGPPSSRWTRMGMNGNGGDFPEPLHEEWDVSGKT